MEKKNKSQVKNPGAPKELIIWNYDDQGVFTHESVARPDPMEPGKFLIPAKATDIKIPKCKKEETCVFDEEKKKWEIVKDYRNKTIYHKETGDPILFYTVGDLPDGFTPKSRPSNLYTWNEEKDKWELDQEKVHKDIQDNFVEEYYEKKYSPIDFHQNTFPTYIKFIQDLTSLLVVYPTDFAGTFKILDINNDIIEFNRAELKELLQSIHSRNQELLTKYSIQVKNVKKIQKENAEG